MSANPTLRLVDGRPASDAIPLDRRGAPRHAVCGRVTAVLREQNAGETHNRICSLALVNMSDGGLGALSDEDMPLNAAISVFFPPHGNERGFDAVGRVVRCRRREDHHDVGVQFLVRAAA